MNEINCVFMIEIVLDFVGLSFISGRIFPFILTFFHLKLIIMWTRVVSN